MGIFFFKSFFLLGNFLKANLINSEFEKIHVALFICS